MSSYHIFELKKMAIKKMEKAFLIATLNVKKANPKLEFAFN